MPFDLSQIKPFLTESTPMICCCNEMISINFWSGWCLAAKNGSHTTISSENVRGRRPVNRPKQRPSRDWRSERCLVGMEGNNSPWAAPSCLKQAANRSTVALVFHVLVAYKTCRTRWSTQNLGLHNSNIIVAILYNTIPYLHMGFVCFFIKTIIN